MYAPPHSHPILLTLTLLCACSAQPRPEIHWRPALASNDTIELPFARGQNGTDLLLTLFERVAGDESLVIQSVAIHFIWDTTRLMQCTSYLVDARSPQVDEQRQPWLALRVETQEVSEEDYLCGTVMEQVFVPKEEKEEKRTRLAPRKARESQSMLPDAQLVASSRCQRAHIKRNATRYLYQFYEQWVPPNWQYIATRYKTPPLRMGKSHCAPMDEVNDQGLHHRLVARVQRGGR